MEQNEKIDMETLEILKNPMVLNWARKFGCDNIKANGDLKKFGETLGFVSKKNSVGFIDKDFVKMLVTNVKIEKSAHTKIGMKQIAEVMRSMGKDEIEKGTLFIQSESGKPCFVEIRDDKSGTTDIITIAPRSTTDEVESKKAKEKQQEKQAKQPKKETDDKESDEETDETDDEDYE